MVPLLSALSTPVVAVQMGEGRAGRVEGCLARGFYWPFLRIEKEWGKGMEENEKVKKKKNSPPIVRPNTPKHLQEWSLVYWGWLAFENRLTIMFS